MLTFMKTLLNTALMYLVLNPSTVLSLNNLLRDSLQDYPSQPNCDLQYVTDQSSKFDSLFSTTAGHEISFRAVTLPGDLSGCRDYEALQEVTFI